MRAPCVYSAVVAITAELASHGIAKSHTNVDEGYKYRSIDDVLDRLAPLLARHHLCVLPRTLERQAASVVDSEGRPLSHVSLRVSFTLTSGEDGSHHSVEVYGEALDSGDKATAKAMSAAYKSAMVQTFCIPVSRDEDADRSSRRLLPRTHEAEPVQGWGQWCADIEDMVNLCESEHALTKVQERYRQLLLSLSRERPERYQMLGSVFDGRRKFLADRAEAEIRSSKASRAKQTRRSSTAAQQRLLDGSAGTVSDSRRSVR